MDSVWVVPSTHSCCTKKGRGGGREGGKGERGCDQSAGWSTCVPFREAVDAAAREKSPVFSSLALLSLSFLSLSFPLSSLCLSFLSLVLSPLPRSLSLPFLVSLVSSAGSFSSLSPAFPPSCFPLDGFLSHLCSVSLSVALSLLHPTVRTLTAGRRGRGRRGWWFMFWVR